jgi:heme A synthase
MASGLSWIAGVGASATLAAATLGLPRAGAFGSAPLEAVGALGLQLATSALALVAWPARRPGARFADSGWPSLRSLAWFAPAITLIQVGLGAAYRYKLASIIPHVAWAFLSAIVLLMCATVVLTHPAAGAALKRLSALLATLVGVQLILGVAALLARVADMAPAAWMPVAAALHVGVGGLVLATTVLVSALILRSLEQPA